ncbi:MAG TPA: glycine cleavage T C-terminal barrel domain-containing protein [Microbacteriaceae bacterium]|nr:glycine cleavage T C-terminal barrel domain-containing protein [Microbacteriaceae bacterium]
MTGAAGDDPFSRLPGAVLGAGWDEGVPAHYGNPLGEQRRLTERGAIVDLSHRVVLRLAGAPGSAGAGRLLLERLGTADIVRASSAETLLLDPSGAVRHALHVIDDGRAPWIIAEASQAGDLERRLGGEPGVALEDRSADFGVIGTFTAELPETASVDGVPLVWHDPWPSAGAGGPRYAAAEPHPAQGWSWHESLVPRESLAALAGRVGAPGVAGALAFDALRVEAWRPRQVTEVDGTLTPRELDWARTAVPRDKVGYPGARALRAAEARPAGRRLVMLYLDGSESVLPRHGAPVWLEVGGERLVVGAVTTGAMHHELGPVALAVVEREVPVRAPLNVDEAETVVPALQEQIVAA